jgi:hypothetical protein
MKSLINTPTVSISPLFLNRKEGFQLVLKISAWGMGEQESISCEIETGVKFESLPNKYSLIEISEMINQITPQAICAIGQLADVFYWVNYYQPPLLPILLGKEKIKVSSTLASQYALGYSDFYKRLVIGNNNEIRKSYSLVADIAEINQYSHPERSLICLKSIMSLTDRYGATSEIIEHSMLSLFSARTDENPESLIKVDSSLLHRQDIDYILKLIEYAKTIDDSRLIKELSEIVKRYVSSWRYTIS